MARLDVKESTLKKLFALSGNQCAFPGCSHPLVNEHGDLVADVCHIEAAEEGGERYNPAQSDEDRRGFENLLVLCPTHHRTTDNVDVYPVERMRKLKQEHESQFAAAPPPTDDVQASRFCTQANEQLRRFGLIARSKLLRHGAEELIGRSEELRRLTKAWNSANTHVVSIVAWGGVGKTALAAEWMGRFAGRNWKDVEAYFDWSFYSQGTREQGEASAEPFINAALRHFGGTETADWPASPADKGAKLAELVAARKTLLILDGLEPLQYPEGHAGLDGRLKDPAVEALLTSLAQRPFAGLCVLTSREPVTDLKTYHKKTVSEWQLEHLSVEAGARLLHQAGARRAGDAQIEPDDEELRDASKEVRGHALTLNLLGRYLALAHGGDIRRRDRVRFEKADAKIQGGHAFRVIAAYERWLADNTGPVRSDRLQPVGAGKEPDKSGHYEPHLAVLRLLGLFDRLADPDCLAALRKPPAIAGLTEPLVDLDEDDWNITLTQLTDLGLISLDSSFFIHHSSFPVDSHPLVREYFASQLQARNPPAWRAAHRRLYEHLCETTEHRPDTVDGLQPLYQAVAHGCQAGLQEQARDDVYVDRILRGGGNDGFYSTFKLGAIGADLGAVAWFFDRPWSRLSPNLSPADRAWLLNEAAFRLRALGRLGEAVEPTRTGLEMTVEQEDWQNAARNANNLSELELTLGDVSAAVTDGEQSVTFADCLDNDWQMFIVARTAHADALHQAGRREEALRLFREAEAMQAKRQPEYPRLYSLQGFQYCDLLAADAERAAWRAFANLVPKLRLGHPDSSEAAPQQRKQSFQEVRSQAGAWERERRGGAWERERKLCNEVGERAVQTLKWAEQNRASLFTIALDHLTLGRAALYGAVLDGADRLRAAADGLWSEPATLHLGAAVDGLRKAGRMDELPRGLISRAWLRFVQGDEPGCRADLDAAQQIAERGAMRLHLADVQLTRARLLRDPDALEAAAELIEKCGYHRRDGELEDGKRMMSDE